MKKQKVGAYLLLILAAIRFVAGTALILAIGALLVLFALQFPHPAKWDSSWPVEHLRHWGDPAMAWVAAKFGWTWPTDAISLLPIGVGFGLLVMKVILDAVFGGIKQIIQKSYPLPEESLALSSSASSKGISVSSTLLALAAVSDKANAKVRRRFERMGQKLDHTKRRWCAFLSVAVVNALEMKQDANPEKVARSFDAYEAMLEEIFRLTGAWKKAWTTDGVMVCYLETGHALEAAQRVLEGLENFNANLNELPQPFCASCGLNEGDVAIFEDSKLQKVADRVIDVAGHMQKHARPNTLWLSSEVYDRLEKKSGFCSAAAQVDGFKVFEWRVPERVPSARTAA